jgi:hypothetical protein
LSGGVLPAAALGTNDLAKAMHTSAVSSASTEAKGTSMRRLMVRESVHLSSAAGLVTARLTGVTCCGDNFKLFSDRR